MRTLQALVTTAAFVFAAGCVGGVDDLPPDTGVDGGVTPTAKKGKQEYVNNVHAIVARCSGAGCHTQPGANGVYGFATTDANSSYDQVAATPLLVGTYTATSAGILTKIKAGDHKGMTYDVIDEGKITTWLAAEVADRAGDPTLPPPVDPVAKLREWSGCMSIDNFNTAQMALRWGNLAANNLQKCANCHGGGLAAFMSGTGQGQAQIFFDTITTQRDLLIKYFTVDNAGAIVINNAAFQSAGVALPDHPRFNPTTNAGMTALTEFYTLTQTRQAAGLCDPPRLPAI